MAWSAFPHPDDAYVYTAATLKKAWARLHVGDAEAFPKKAEINGKSESAYYSKDAAGKPSQVVFVEKGLYPPNCTHTWVVALDAQSGNVKEVRPVEFSCPHALPTKTASFLDQFKGKGPADAAKLEAEVTTIAKATGTSVLAAKAVQHSIVTYQKMKGQF